MTKKRWTLSARKEDFGYWALCCPYVVSMLKQILESESLVVLAHKRQRIQRLSWFHGGNRESHGP